MVWRCAQDHGTPSSRSGTRLQQSCSKHLHIFIIRLLNVFVFDYYCVNDDDSTWQSLSSCTSTLHPPNPPKLLFSSSLFVGSRLVSGSLFHHRFFRSFLVFPLPFGAYKYKNGRSIFFRFGKLPTISFFPYYFLSFHFFPSSVFVHFLILLCNF